MLRRGFRPTTVMRTFVLVGRVGLVAIVAGAVAGTVAGAVACSDLSKTAFPAGVSDPDTYHTPSGALQLYAGAVYSFTGGAGVSSPITGKSGINKDYGAFSRFVLASGLLTDELQAGNLGGNPADYPQLQQIIPADSIDARLPFQGGEVRENVVSGVGAIDNVYGTLQNVRGAAAQAIGALAAYAPATSPALRGHMYALAGYAELALADLFCSGVPLSTVNFNADYTYQPGSTTIQVYQHALALFDTALTLATDSVRILNLAKIGRGRSFLALGRYTDAAQAVADVPTTYQYVFSVNWGVLNGSTTTLFEGKTVSDAEGLNGLPFITSGDPRSAIESYESNFFGIPQYAPVKYGVAAPSAAPLVLASGVEARLIEAEAALQAHPTNLNWLTILNTVRTTCSDAASCPAPAPAGTGNVAGLPPLSDPGSDTARVTLLFTERAYWLFLTGERQGDLRRLVRNYKRNPETVYPTGEYPIGPLLPRYGHAVSLSIPQTEFLNPKFTGCLSQGA